MHHYFASIEDRKWNLPREGMVAHNQTLELHEILFTPYLLIIILTNDHNHKKQRNENMHVHHVLYMTPIGHPEASTLLFEMEKWSILPDGFMFESLSNIFIVKTWDATKQEVTQFCSFLNINSLVQSNNKLLKNMEYGDM